MATAQELRWSGLTQHEQEVATSCGKLANAEDFNYYRITGNLFAVDEEHSYIVNIDAEYSDVDAYEEFFAYVSEGDDGITNGSCLIPITTDKELTEEEVCKEYLGVDPEHISDFTIGF